VGPHTATPVDPETAEAMTALAFFRVREAADLDATLARLRNDYRMLEIAHEQAALTAEKVEAQKQTILTSRAFRLVDTYWRAREGARTYGRKAARHAPRPLRPIAAKLAPPAANQTP